MLRSGVGEPYLCRSPTLFSPMPQASFLDPDDPEAEAAWQDLWVRAGQRSPFTHLAFVRAAAAATGRKARLAVVAEEAYLVAGCVLYAHRGGTLATPAPLTRYTGVLLDPSPHERHLLQRQSALDRLLELVRAHWPVVSLSLAPDVADVRPFQWAGFRCEPRYTYRIEEEYRPARSVRRRLGEMPEYSIQSASPDDPAVNVLLQRHYQVRHTAAPLSVSQQAAWLEALTRIGMARCLALYDAEGVLSAALAVLEDDRRTYTWLAGSRPGPALTILQHTLIEQVVAEGRSVDLLGANHPTIAFFKAGFCGDAIVHFHAVHYRSPALRLLGALRPLA